MKVKYLILGAGPAGLTVANRLKNKGITDFYVLEKEDEVGGLCRSCIVDGKPFDIGGGHFLDVKRCEVTDYLFSFMPKEEWNFFERDSRIFLQGYDIGHPIEANIWQLPIDLQIQYLKSAAAAGCNNGQSVPQQFIDWIYWKLGERIANDYMLPYNRKVFGRDLNILGTYWLEKLPDVSFEETLRSCLERKVYGSEPAHENFYYPKVYGYGEVWRRMGENIQSHIKYHQNIMGLDVSKQTVFSETGEWYEAEYIITTIPWKAYKRLWNVPDKIREAIDSLKYSAIETRYYHNNLDTKAQWIYCPDEDRAYHRILVRHNFCPGSVGYWTETNKERVVMIPREEQQNVHYLNEYAYPLNTLGKPEAMEKIMVWAHENGIYPLGRWGEHQHFNSDVTVQRAMRLADEIDNSCLL